MWDGQLGVEVSTIVTIWDQDWESLNHIDWQERIAIYVKKLII